MRTSRLHLPALLVPLALVAVATLASPARADDDGAAQVYSASLRSGLQALRENADAVGLEHLADTAAMTASTEALPVRSTTSPGSQAPLRAGLLTPAR